MVKLLGPHCLGDWSKYIDLIGRWKPPLALVLSPNPDEVARLKKASPDTKVIARLYHDDSFYADGIRKDPERLAVEINDQIRKQHVPGLYDFWQTNNEVAQSWDMLPNLDAYSRKWMELANAHGYKCAILSTSVGNFDLPNKPGDPAGFNGNMLYWQRVLNSLLFAQRHGHILNIHQYNRPNLINNNQDDDWLLFRFERKVLPNFPALGLNKLKVAITELGVDFLIDGNLGGYKKSMNDDHYVNQLLEWEKVEQKYKDTIIGGLIFTAGTQHPWDSYSITSNSTVMEKLANYYQSNPQPANKVEIEDTTMPVIFVPEKPDTSARVSDGAKKANIAVVPSKLGGKVFKVKDVFTTHNGEWKESNSEFSVPKWAIDGYLVAGNSALGADHHVFVLALDKNGQIIRDIAFDFWSDGLDKQNDPKYKNYTTMIPGKDGWVNMPLFAGSKYVPGRGEMGPWSIRINQINSDVVTGVGLPNQWHISTFIVFQETEGDFESIVEREYDYFLDFHSLRQMGFKRVVIKIPSTI